MTPDGWQTVNDGWKRWISVAGGIASIAVLATTIWNSSCIEDAESGVERAGDYQFVPWGETGDEEVEPVSVELPEGDDRWIQFVDGDDRPVEADVLVSAPGMWPFDSDSSDGSGFLDLPPPPIDKLSGQPLAMYEVVARSTGDDREFGYWGTVEGPDQKVAASEAREIELAEGHPLKLEVTDIEGRPIDGAHIRLGRDNIGLVHLDETTGPDGRASFDGLPPQSYHATVDAEGFAQTEVTITHRDSSRPLQVAMQDGGGLSMPQAWRGPSVREMAESGDDSETGESSTARGGSSSATGQAGQTLTETASASASGSTGATDSDRGAESGDEEFVDLDVWVVEPGRDGVGEAWIEVWADGRRVDEAVSDSGDSTPMRVPTGADIDVVATHPASGIGEAWVGVVEEDEEVAVQLDMELFSRTAAVDRIVWIDDAEDILEADLVAEGPRWVVDGPDPGGAGARAGIEDGDSVFFLREESFGYLAVVERGGRLLEFELL